MNRPPQEPEGKQATRYELGKRVFIVAVLMFMVAALSLLVVNSFQSRANTQATKENTQAIKDTQDEGSPTSIKLLDILRSVQTTGDQIHSCVTPGETCYRDAKARQAFFLQATGAYITCAVRFTDLPEDEGFEATDACFAKWTKDHLP